MTVCSSGPRSWTRARLFNRPNITDQPDSNRVAETRSIRSVHWFRTCVRRPRGLLLPLVMGLDGLCSTSPAGGFAPIPSSDVLISIDEPVGQGFKARNVDGDVRT